MMQFNYEGNIMLSWFNYERSIVVASFIGGNGFSIFETDDDIIWQLKLPKDVEESCFACMYQTH